MKMREFDGNRTLGPDDWDNRPLVFQEEYHLSPRPLARHGLGR